jgi:3-methyladenine DNA glycosylase AlkD
MTSKEIMNQLQSMGSENIKKILFKHGVKEPFFGVKVEQLKIIQKKVKVDYALAKDLYDTGNADAMYLAGLIADDAKMTKSDLQLWAKQAVSQNISEYTVPWVAAGSQHGFALAMEWINSKEEHIAATGWATLSNLVSLKSDDELDIGALRKLFGIIEKSIHASSNRVRYTMNGFLIAAGTYVTSLTTLAVSTAKKIGHVSVDMEGTSCKVPEVADYIEKVRLRSGLGKKKKKVKC